MNIIISIRVTVNAFNFMLVGIVVILGIALVVVLEDNQALAKELELQNKLQAAELIETFKTKYSDHKITEYPNSKGIPYKYVADTEHDTVELLLEKDRVVLKAWKENKALCIVSNPIPRDILDSCPLKW